MGLVEEPPTGLIPWFSKTEGNTYATIAASPFPLQGKPTQAQDIARRFSRTIAGEASTKSSKDSNSRQRAISGAVAWEVFAQVKTYQVPITNSSPSHYIICHFPLIFLSPLHPCHFIRPSSVRFFVCLSLWLVLYLLSCLLRMKF